MPSLNWPFPGSLAGKESTCNSGDPVSIPESRRSAGEGIGYPLQCSWASLVAQLVKNLPAMWETWVQSLGWENPLDIDAGWYPAVPLTCLQNTENVAQLTNNCNRFMSGGRHTCSPVQVGLPPKQSPLLLKPRIHTCYCLVPKLYLTFCNPMYCSLPDSSVHGISQARILE